MTELVEHVRAMQQDQGSNLQLRPSADISRNPAVTIAVPALGTHRSLTSISLAAMAAHSIMSGIQINLVGQDLSGISRNRNSLCQVAIETRSTHILQIDSDMTFPPDLLVRLLLHGKDIVGVPYPRRAPPYELLGRPKYPERGDQSGLVEMAMLPAGLLLIKLDALKRIPQPWFFESYKYGEHPFTQFRNVLKDAFSRKIPACSLDQICKTAYETGFLNETGDMPLTQERSEDINFGFKAQRHGFQLWGDLDLLREIGHCGDQVVRVGGTPESDHVVGVGTVNA